jgi:hypothetical protein
VFIPNSAMENGCRFLVRVQLSHTYLFLCGGNVMKSCIVFPKVENFIQVNKCVIMTKFRFYSLNPFTKILSPFCLWQCAK